MRLPDKKRIMVILIAAVIITIIVNFPHLFNSFSSEKVNFPMGDMMHRKPPMPQPQKHFDSPQFQFFQVIWYFVFSFILTLITSAKSRTNRDSSSETLYDFLKVIVIVSIFFIAENFFIRIYLDNMNMHLRKGFDGVLISRYIFVVVISYLTGFLLKMVDHQTQMEVENEKLRSENLQIRYNALTNQMNPHFFFNTLNSLQSLVIEGDNYKSVRYINELSTVFRYTLQSSKKELVKLKDEIDFLKAYRYLLEIRYEEKIIFNINIPSQFLDCELPVLTIQPLVENAINHNSCSLSNPLIIDIFINEGNLIVKNNKIKKIRVEKSSGIGLDNLRNRFQLLLNKSITIENTDRIFSVTLPLQQH